jgi:MoxR-like ATPase
LDFLSGLLEWRFYLLMAAAVVTALYLLFRWLAQRQASVRQLSAPVSSELQSLSLADLLQAAQAEASGGHYRLALRHLHTAVLIYLDRLGILNYEPTKTDWEHLQALRRRGRDFVLPDDVKYLALPILRHRLILKPEAEIEGIKPDPAIQTLVDAISVPR